MKTRILLAGLLVALSATLATHGLSVRAVSQKTRASIEDLAWMEGRWTGAAFGGTVEEVWSGAAGGGMMGMFRLVDEEGKLSLYEFLLIEEGTKGPQLSFKHFGPGYKPWEEEPLVFEFASSTEHAIEFVTSDLEQSPTHMSYSHPDENQMLVTVQTIREGRDTESFDVLFKRAD